MGAVHHRKQNSLLFGGSVAPAPISHSTDSDRIGPVDSTGKDRSQVRVTSVDTTEALPSYVTVLWMPL